MSIMPHRYRIFEPVRCVCDTNLGRKLFFITLVLLGAVSQQVVAVETAVPIRVGESNLYPSLRLDYLQTDNTFRTSTGEIESAATIVRPRLRWEADRSVTSLSAVYVGAFSTADESRTDYQDHRLGFSLETNFSKRSNLKTVLGFEQHHEPLGTGLSRDDSTAPDEQNKNTQVDFKIEHTYGASQARGNLLTGLDLINRYYTNNKAQTRFSNRFVVEPYLIFYIRHAGDTRWFLDLRYAQLNFDESVSDGANIRSFVGVAWESTGKTGGEAKIGGVTRSYDAGQPTQSTAAIDIQLYYNTSSISRFDFRAVREFEGLVDSQTALDGKEAIVNRLALSWDYKWSSRFRHRISIANNSFERECPFANDSAENQASLELTYQVRRWLAFGANAKAYSRSSDTCGDTAAQVNTSDYDRQQFGIHTIVNL